ncbi:MAG: septum formation initiator family protein [bacterium]
MITQIKKNKKRDSNKLSFFSIFFFLLFFLITVFFVFSSERVYGRKKELTDQVEELEKQLQELEQKNEDLKASISRATDDDYLEEGARERLSLKKPGEEVVVVLPSEGSDGLLPENIKTNKGFWEIILEKLGF